MSTPPHKLCVLCAEVSDSVRLHQKLGGAETLYAIERCVHRMERASAGFNGRLVQAGASTKVLAVFDAAEDAFLAANEMQQRVADLPPVSGIKLAIKVAYHYGISVEANDDVSGDGATRAWRLASLARPGQIITTGDTLNVLPPLLRRSVRALRQDSELILSDEGEIFEVLWQESAMATQNMPEAVGVPGDMRLSLRHGDQLIAVGPDKVEVAFGRDPCNDMVIKDPRASRRHARIECRHDQFVIADKSSNGTFVAFDGGIEVALKRKELVLHGRGHICFGRAYGPETAEVVEFELLNN